MKAFIQCIYIAFTVIIFSFLMGCGGGGGSAPAASSGGSAGESTGTWSPVTVEAKPYSKTVLEVNWTSNNYCLGYKIWYKTPTEESYHEFCEFSGISLAGHVYVSGLSQETTYQIQISMMNPGSSTVYWLETPLTATTLDHIPTQMTSGIPFSESVEAGHFKYYSISVPQGSTNLKIEVKDLTSDVDLYVRKSDFPTTSSYDTYSAVGGTAPEVINLNASSYPQLSSGTWCFGVFGYTAASYTVVATVTPAP